MTEEDKGGGSPKKIRVELEFEDLADVKTVEVEKTDLDVVLTIARSMAGFENAHVFERDSDDVLTGIGDRRAVILLVHRCRHIEVEFHYEHLTKHETFSPAATIQRVLRWAVGKKGFNLDDNAAAKANLMLAGADQPLPKDTMLGRYAKHPGCAVTLDLTLKDFTNG